MLHEMLHVKPGPLEGSRCFMLSLGPWKVKMFHVKPGLLEGSKCFMLSLEPWKGQDVSCQAWAPGGQNV